MDGAKGLQEFATNLDQCEDPFSLFQTFIEARGGTGYLYGIASMKTDPTQFDYSKAVFFHQTYGAAWAELSPNKPSIDDDPMIERIIEGENFIEWVPENIRDYENKLTPAQRKQHHAEEDLGIEYGCSFAIDRSSLGISGLGYWAGGITSGQEFRQLWDRFGQEISQGASMLDLHIRNDRPNLLIGLTAREIDCVSWLAAGLRPSEICWKLTISEKTFEKHISNAKSKLKARTRDNAVAKAILFGLIKL